MSSELRAMHQAEQCSSQNNSEPGTSTNSFCLAGAKKSRNPEITCREEWVQISAKHGFLDERRNEYSHAHQQKCAGSVLKEILNGRCSEFSCAS